MRLEEVGELAHKRLISHDYIVFGEPGNKFANCINHNSTVGITGSLNYHPIS